MKRSIVAIILVCTIHSPENVHKPASHYQVKPGFIDNPDLPEHLKIQFNCFHQIKSVANGIQSPLYFRIPGEDQGQG